MSKTQQMRAFAVQHRGKSFTATGLARELGWSSQKTRRVIVLDAAGDPVRTDGGQLVEREETYTCHNSKAAKRIARKVARSCQRDPHVQTTITF